MIFTSSGSLPTSLVVAAAQAQRMDDGGGGGTVDTPEIPLMLIPLFVAVTMTALLYMRANMAKRSAVTA